MQLDFSTFTIENFLSDYWQQKPVIIKQGIKDFSHPCDADILAGLAMENHVESRLIYQNQGVWQAESGPFESYERFGERDWTLVVQSVNHWLPAAQQFAQLFDFIPQWRFDDVMVSFAAPNGSVGPHVDNYDVFICQGSGQRRWTIGQRSDSETLIVHEQLRHVRPFEPIIDEVVSAGDIVYIPPGYPHEGISINQSMSFSVGYKAVNATELLSGFADYCIDSQALSLAYDDSGRSVVPYGQISQDDEMRLRSLLQSTLSDQSRLNHFFGCYYSQSTSELDLAPRDYTFDEWLTIFSSTPLQKLYALKCLFIESSINDGIFYVDGERQQLKQVPVSLIRQLCDTSQLTADNVVLEHNEYLQWLWAFTNRGYWYFDES